MVTAGTSLKGVNENETPLPWKPPRLRCSFVLTGKSKRLSKTVWHCPCSGIDRPRRAKDKIQLNQTSGARDNLDENYGIGFDRHFRCLGKYFFGWPPARTKTNEIRLPKRFESSTHLVFLLAFDIRPEHP